MPTMSEEYEYDEELYFDICDRMDSRVCQAIMNPGRTGKERFVNALKESYDPVVNYSAYHTDESDMPIDNLDEIPFRGTFVVKSDSYTWGEGTFESNPITDPTWLELAVLANAAIHVTGDDHHVFFEGVSKPDDNTLELSFGS